MSERFLDVSKSYLRRLEKKERIKLHNNVKLKTFTDNPNNIPNDSPSPSLIKNSNAISINKPLSQGAQIIISNLGLFQKTINNQFEYLNKKVAYIEDYVKHTKETSQKITNILENVFDSRNEYFKFPISNQKQLDELESKLNDENMKQKLTILLTDKYKGRPLKHAIKDMFTPIFLSDEYSLTGRKKKNFCTLIIHSVLKDVFPTDFPLSLENAFQTHRCRAYKHKKNGKTEDGNETDDNEDERMEDDDE